MPWILEPSQSKRVGHKTSIMRGAPEPVRYKNGAEKTEMTEANSATLDLNQRFNNRISKNPNRIPKIMLGSLIVKNDKPNMEIMIF